MVNNVGFEQIDWFSFWTAGILIANGSNQSLIEQIDWFSLLSCKIITSDKSGRPDWENWPRVRAADSYNTPCGIDDTSKQSLMSFIIGTNVTCFRSVRPAGLGELWQGVGAAGGCTTQDQMGLGIWGVPAEAGTSYSDCVENLWSKYSANQNAATVITNFCWGDA